MSKTRVLHVKCFIGNGNNYEECFKFDVGRDVFFAELAVRSRLTEIKKKPENESLMNHGFFVPSKPFSNTGTFLACGRSFAEYGIIEDNTMIQFKLRERNFSNLTALVNAKDINNQQIREKFLHYVRTMRIDKFEHLLRKGLDPNFVDMSSGETPLSLTTMHRYPGQLVEILVSFGAVVDFRSLSGSTALHKAIVQDNHECLKALLRNGASPNLKDLEGDSLIHYAVMQRSGLVFFEVLLEAKANVEELSSTGMTPLQLACSMSFYTPLPILLRNGADPFRKSAIGNNSFEICKRREFTAGLALLQPLMETTGDVDGNIEKRIESINESKRRAAKSLGRDVDRLSDCQTDGKLRVSSPADEFGQPSINRASPNSPFVARGDIKSAPESINVYSNISSAESQYASPTTFKSQEYAKSKDIDIVIFKMDTGYGFDLSTRYEPNSKESIQTVISVKKGGAAETAGLRVDDRLITVGNVQVKSMSHVELVKMIKNTPCLLRMTILREDMPEKTLDAIVPAAVDQGKARHGSGAVPKTRSSEQTIPLQSSKSDGNVVATKITAQPSNSPLSRQMNVPSYIPNAEAQQAGSRGNLSFDMQTTISADSSTAGLATKPVKTANAASSLSSKEAISSPRSDAVRMNNAETTIKSNISQFSIDSKLSDTQLTLEGLMILPPILEDYDPVTPQSPIAVDNRNNLDTLQREERLATNVLDDILEGAYSSNLGSFSTFSTFKVNNDIGSENGKLPPGLIDMSKPVEPARGRIESVFPRNGSERLRSPEELVRVAVEAGLPQYKGILSSIAPIGLSAITPQRMIAAGIVNENHLRLLTAELSKIQI